MNRYDKINHIHTILKRAKNPVPRVHFEETLECSRSTTLRLFEEMRTYFFAPLEFNREKNGWYYDENGDTPFELPGLWFNSSELYALLASQEFLTNIQPGILGKTILPLREKIQSILKAHKLDPDEVSNRIKILSMAEREVLPSSFTNIAQALLQRNRIKIVYFGREQNRETEREISPQRLLRYRDNWYLDAWCHKRNELRTFSIDRIKKTEPLTHKAKNVSDKELDKWFTSSYGIFSGKADKTAELHFTGQAAKWVKNETWHPKQKGKLEKGVYKLNIPYSDSRELIGDILRWIPEAEVIEPPELREEIKRRIQQALKKM